MTGKGLVAQVNGSEIAIGAGTDVAIETADVVLVNSNPVDILHTLKLSKASHRKMVQNLGWAEGYNIIAIPLQQVY